MDGERHELATLRFEVGLLRRRMQSSIDRGNGREVTLIGICKTMIAEREHEIRTLERLNRPGEVA